MLLFMSTLMHQTHRHLAVNLSRFCITSSLGCLVLSSFCSDEATWLGMRMKRWKLLTHDISVSTQKQDNFALSLSEPEHKYECRGSASVYLNRKFLGVVFLGKCFQIA